MIGIQPARIGKNPDTRCSDSLFLPSDLCMRPVESNSIRAYPYNCEPRRLELSHLSLQRDSTCSIFFIAKLGCSCGRTAHDRSYSVAE